MTIKQMISAVFLLATPALVAQSGNSQACASLPSHAALKTALQTVQALNNGGLGFHMWATVVNRDGEVCAVAFSGADRGSQWPGSRVISAQKANTANAFSLPGFALSTANLYSAVQPGGSLWQGPNADFPSPVPGGSLFGLQFSNPVDTGVAYAGPSQNYGQPNDPMTGQKIGGVNVFGGGLALYKPRSSPAGSPTLVGALGVSGDTSCSDHIIAWRVRHALNLDDVPGGLTPPGQDNIIHDIVVSATTPGVPSSLSGFGHPVCTAKAIPIAVSLPVTAPIGPLP